MFNHVAQVLDVRRLLHPNQRRIRFPLSRRAAKNPGTERTGAHTELAVNPLCSRNASARERSSIPIGSDYSSSRMARRSDASAPSPIAGGARGRRGSVEDGILSPNCIRRSRLSRGRWRPGFASKSPCVVQTGCRGEGIVYPAAWFSPPSWRIPWASSCPTVNTRLVLYHLRLRRVLTPPASSTAHGA